MVTKLLIKRFKKENGMLWKNLENCLGKSDDDRVFVSNVK